MIELLIEIDQLMSGESTLCVTAGVVLLGQQGYRWRRRLPPVLPRRGLRDLPVLRLRETPGEVQLLHDAQRLHAPSLRWHAADLQLALNQVRVIRSANKALARVYGHPNKCVIVYIEK